MTGGSGHFVRVLSTRQKQNTSVLVLCGGVSVVPPHGLHLSVGCYVQCLAGTSTCFCCHNCPNVTSYLIAGSPPCMRQAVAQYGVKRVLHLAGEVH